jgi:hypothetical protein
MEFEKENVAKFMTHVYSEEEVTPKLLREIQRAGAM